MNNPAKQRNPPDILAGYAPRGPVASIQISGAPYELGYQHGSLLAQQVRGSVDLYKTRFEEAGLQWDEALDKAREFQAVLTEYDPALFRELEGIAAGSNQKLLAITAINARSEILESMGRSPVPPGDHECTSAACLPSTTKNGHTFLARNWDQDLRVLDNVAVIQAEPESDANFVMLTEAGILIRDGVNEHGIGVTGNSLSTVDEGKDLVPGVSAAFVRRRALRHRELEDAVGEFAGARQSISMNHLLASAEGSAISLEVTPGEAFTVLPENGILVHSNHFISERAKERVRDDGPRRSLRTLARRAVLIELLGSNRGHLDLMTVREAFRDHTGWPDSVCRHPSSATSTPSGTIASVAMDLDQRVLWVALHPACESTWASFAVP